MKIIKAILLVVLDSFLYLFYEIKDFIVFIFSFIFSKKKTKKNANQEIDELIRKSEKNIERNFIDLDKISVISEDITNPGKKSEIISEKEDNDEKSSELNENNPNLDSTINSSELKEELTNIDNNQASYIIDDSDIEETIIVDNLVSEDAEQSLDTILIDNQEIVSDDNSESEEKDDSENKQDGKNVTSEDKSLKVASVKKPEKKHNLFEPANTVSVDLVDNDSEQSRGKKDKSIKDDSATDFKSSVKKLLSRKHKSKTYEEKKQTPFKVHLLRVVFVMFVLVGTFLVYVLWDLPDYRVLENYRPPLTTRIFTSDGYIMSEYALQKRSFVSDSEIPTMIKDAFTSAEDKNFYHHFGFDFQGIARAMFNNVLYMVGLSHNITGASTISQQVVKNLLLSQDRTIRRKIREAVLTVKIELAFSKAHILELYLNQIYLGNDSYGVAMAALNYFGKPVNELTLAESAYLASIPKAPAKYDPVTHNEFALRRRNWVLERMYIDGKITKEQMLAAQQDPLVAKERKNLDTVTSGYASEEVRKEVLQKFDYDTLYNDGLSVKTSINNKYQLYAYDALRRGISDYDIRKGYRGPLDSLFKLDNTVTQSNLFSLEDGLPIWYVKLNKLSKLSHYQKIGAPWDVAVVLEITDNNVSLGLPDKRVVELNLQDNTWAVPYKVNNRNKKLKSFADILSVGDIIFVEESGNKYFLRQIPLINGAIVAMNPQNGQILAMQGGYSFLLSEFNRATQAYRQPGSAFKPFLYLAAMERGFKASDLLLDAPFVANSSTNDWKPRNNLGVYTGFVTVRQALEKSKNLATIRLGNAVGLNYISNLAKRIGVYNDDIADMSGFLGSKETTLVNLVRSYSVLVNGGKGIKTSLVNLVQDKDGNILYKTDVRDCPGCNSVSWGEQSPPKIEDTRPSLVDPKDAYLVVNLMQGVVERGTGRRAKIRGYNIAGKTGTTNDVKDAWFIGFTPDLIVGVYIGADNPQPLGSIESATSISVPIFARFMSRALIGKEALPFRIPEGITLQWIDYKTGYSELADKKGAILEAFKDDQHPDSKEKYKEKSDLFEMKSDKDDDDSSTDDSAIW